MREEWVSGAEVGVAQAVIGPVRDSRNPHGFATIFPTPAWPSFVTAVRKVAFLS
ncbi:DUF397 domain-containing protein [Streptomyces sp. NPDC058000]|uniref:DUF397 domain-containing protein n=1 Tax=Streptomyces sp. NPDC058000 TaxID=3346299 RepID=UPI0036E4F085